MPVPADLIAQRDSLQGAIRRVAALLGDSAATSDALYAKLPTTLAQVPAFTLILNPEWRYDLGDEFTRLSTSATVAGSAQWPSVRDLYRSIRVLDQLVADPAKSSLLHRLDQSAKHSETLAELAPLLYLAPSATAEYEPPGLGIGNRLIDWQFERSSCTPCLLEVKKRWDAVGHIEQIIPGIEREDPLIQPPPPDPCALFKDTVDKFVAADPSTRLQGVWLLPGLQYDRAEVAKCFAALDPQRLHFLVVGDWGRIAQTHTRTPEIQNSLGCILQVT